MLVYVAGIAFLLLASGLASKSRHNSRQPVGTLLNLSIFSGESPASSIGLQVSGKDSLSKSAGKNQSWAKMRLNRESGKSRHPSTQFGGKSTHLLSKAKLYLQSTQMGPHRISLKEANMAKHATLRGVAHPFWF